MSGTPPFPRLPGSQPRLEDERLLRGEASFAADMRLPDMLDVAFVRSGLPHARISRIETSAARSAQGVIDVVTAADLDAFLGGRWRGAHRASLPR